jgi:hypothetical protein
VLRFERELKQCQLREEKSWQVFCSLNSFHSNAPSSIQHSVAEGGGIGRISREFAPGSKMPAEDSICRFQPERSAKKVARNNPVPPLPVEKLRMGGHHNGYGVRGERIQEFAEIEERRAATARTDRRKPGVTRRNAVSKIKKSQKIPLTEFGAQTILPLRQ